MAVSFDHLAYRDSMPVVAESELREATREVATALLPELPSIGAGTAAYIGAAMPEVAQTGVAELVEASCHANSGTHRCAFA